MPAQTTAEGNLQVCFLCEDPSLLTKRSKQGVVALDDLDNESILQVEDTLSLKPYLAAGAQERSGLHSKLI